MAPSKKTSCEGHLPAIVGSEIDILAKLLQDLSVGPVAGADSEMDDVEGHMMVEDRENEVLGSTRQGVASEEAEGQSSASQTTSDPVDVVRVAFMSLSVGSLAHLFLNRHISSNLAAPPDVNWPIPGPSMHLRGFVPRTTIEEALLMALRDTEAGEDALKLRIAQLQASNVLNALYCQKLRGQLAHKEKKTKEKRDSKGKGKLMGDGLPCFLSGDVFYERVVEFEARQKGEAREAEARKDARGANAEALGLWKKEDKERVARNNEVRRNHKEAIAVWEEARKAARATKKRFTLKKLCQELLRKVPSDPRDPNMQRWQSMASRTTTTD